MLLSVTVNCMVTVCPIAAAAGVITNLLGIGVNMPFAIAVDTGTMNKAAMYNPTRPILNSFIYVLLRPPFETYYYLKNKANFSQILGIDLL